MKKFLVPLQAFIALILCSGMAWMAFILSSINPAPPTAMDLQARNTQDLSFANMNSTAMALAKEMIADFIPSPVPTFNLPVTGGDTATVVPLVTLRALPTVPATPTTFSLFSNLFTPTAARERSQQSIPSSTSTLVPTVTLRPPTAIATFTLNPTSTRIAATSTPIPLPTSTPNVVSTNTSVVATTVPVDTNTPRPTNTTGPTNTPKPTKTPKRPPSNTPEPPPTHYP